MMFATRINPAIASSARCAQRHMASTRPLQPRDAVIVAGARTPILSFLGEGAKYTAPQLAAHAIKKVLSDSGVDGSKIEEAIFGNVVSAGVGQAPARQAAKGAGLPDSVICTTVNKVCSSGMKSVMYAAQAIKLGERDVILAGGMESMSNAPFYLPGARSGYKYGNQKALDGVLVDGLWDPYNDFHMGNCGEKTSKDYGISREDQDNYALSSYQKAQNAIKAGVFDDEIAPLPVGRSGKLIKDDEEPNKINKEKFLKLKPAFQKDGTITAGNASSLNDGASALLVMSSEKANELGLKPLCRIVSYGDAEIAPIDFGVAPAEAVKEAMKRAGVEVADIKHWEVNEAFSSVAIAQQKILGFPLESLNINGGAVAMGHPIGMSGNRITLTLAHRLNKAPKGELACASICNGGGGASAIILESL
ncbi:acetyl-CoA C-acetyltransferase [Sphaeroforma arctica JP610]|uniref:Acetyl-CoA C-acetyltransferase n=1 Tax=Sphaeroforma arctica JP610 TaxID=667725 RepID=A0A0L0G701_9EUKA|nr:acetyl-CoA C-acetyltransferase [Sphaeroforma arctica JP610]KNC84003.1 acetyl-CoA C-acetyltransferase [Sphaeroforma arctica JP610]|eukprot:XP_014157905.1 acetyl-CoA C-acetyltransferase [Sphaeroforma arctica JP610]